MSSEKGKYNKHIETNHIRRASQECPQHKKQFSTRNALNFHVSIQHREEATDTRRYDESNEGIKHKCGKCDYATATKWYLRIHI